MTYRASHSSFVEMALGSLGVVEEQEFFHYAMLAPGQLKMPVLKRNDSEDFSPTLSGLPNQRKEEYVS